MELTTEQLRRYLSLLRRPDRLNTPELVELLEHHDRLPAGATAMQTGLAAAQLLTDTIERLRLPDGASRDESIPYLVLRTCFVDGAKLCNAASRLGMSERQLTRERARAIDILAAELTRAPESFPAPFGRGPRAVRDTVRRPEITAAVVEALGESDVVFVTGPPGSGKTALLGDLVDVLGRTTETLWYAVRAATTTAPSALLFELGEFQSARGFPALADYIAAALPSVDVSVATRLGTRGFDGRPVTLVLDDVHLVEGDEAFVGLLDALTHVRGVRVVAASRYGVLPSLSGTAITVPPFSAPESAGLLRALGVVDDADILSAVHEWSEGNPQLLRLAAERIRARKFEPRASVVAGLAAHEPVNAFLVKWLSTCAPTDRAALAAVAVMRGACPLDAIGAVAGQAAGVVSDSAARLARCHVVVPGADGAVAFGSMRLREYVYDRLPYEELAELHTRASAWFKARGDLTEAAHHRERVRFARSSMRRSS